MFLRVLPYRDFFFPETVELLLDLVLFWRGEENNQKLPHDVINTSQSIAASLHASNITFLRNGCGTLLEELQAPVLTDVL